MVFFAFLGCFVESVLIDINECDDVVTESNGLGVGLAFSIGANDGDIETLACGILAPEKEIWSCEETCCEAGGRADEAAAGEWGTYHGFVDS